MKQNLVDYFNPHDISHIIAYRELQITGQWPKDFWEQIKDMDKDPCWSVSIAYKLAECYIELKLKDEK
jgi:hypothetical protein